MKDSAACACTPEVLAMCSFPKQKWCEPYEWNTALYQGTIFPCLNLMFYAAEEIPCSFLDSAGLSDREKAMNQISMIGFAINDLTLYLDTHPDCEQGKELMKDLLKKRLDGLADYAEKYDPLTQLSIITGNPASPKYEWDEGPAPWEGGLI